MCHKNGILIKFLNNQYSVVASYYAYTTVTVVLGISITNNKLLDGNSGVQCTRVTT